MKFLGRNFSAPLPLRMYAPRWSGAILEISWMLAGTLEGAAVGEFKFIMKRIFIVFMSICWKNYLKMLGLWYVCEEMWEATVIWSQVPVFITGFSQPALWVIRNINCDKICKNSAKCYLLYPDPDGDLNGDPDPKHWKAADMIQRFYPKLMDNVVFDSLWNKIHLNGNFFV